MTEDARPVRPTDGTIELVEYRAEWPEMFETERQIFEQQLGHAFVRIEHIGSTAVPGMPSKPTIDIAGVVRSVDDVLDELDTLYAAAKRELFARFPGDRMGYVEAKSLVVDALITRMRNSPSP